MKVLYLFIFTLLLTPIFAQDYAYYYESCNRADSLAYYVGDQAALDEIKKGFESVDYVHSENYMKAYSLAIRLKKFDEAFYFGRMIIINSGQKNRIHTKSRDFKKSKQYQLLLDSTSHYLTLYNSRINHGYIQLIDSLLYVDQHIIRGSHNIKGNYQIDKATLPENKYELDSKNWGMLSHLIDSLGFPSEQNVGAEAYYNAWIIIHHNLRLKENEAYHPKIFEFVGNGDYLPKHFSFWYEQYQTNVHDTSYFYTWDGNLSEENLKRIDQNRRRFWLKGLNSVEIKKNGRKFIGKW